MGSKYEKLGLRWDQADETSIIMIFSIEKMFHHQNYVSFDKAKFSLGIFQMDGPSEAIPAMIQKRQT